MLKKRIILIVSTLLVISVFAMMISAAPLVKSVKSAGVSATEAENISLERVGLTRDNIRFERTELDRERGKLIWEVEFKKGSTEYSFEIDASSGKIVREEIEEERIPPSAPAIPPVSELPAVEPPVSEPPVSEPPVSEPPATEPSAPKSPTVTELTKEQAIEIALTDAGLTREQVKELEAEKDRENGVWVYEVEFEHGKTEYGYEIRVSDGKILDRDVDLDDKKNKNQSGGTPPLLFFFSLFLLAQEK